MLWFMRIIAWRSKQPAVVRWLVMFALYGFALAARLVLGGLHGGIPSLAFWPVLLVVSVLLGWKEALVILGLSVMTGLFLFLPPGMYLLPVGWVLVGGFTIAIIHALKTLAHELADANQRQRVLFRELQHRVANTLQSVTGILDNARRKIGTAPEEAKSILEEGMRRILASAEVHRRLNDPALFEQGLDSILRDAVATVIDADFISLRFDIQEVGLSFDQMSIITMLVIEFANNAQKHVFDRDLGRRFVVNLRALPDGRAVLTAKDDGPAWSQTESGGAERTLGQAILHGLTDQLDGSLSVKWEEGTEASVVFPTRAYDQSSRNEHERMPPSEKRHEWMAAVGTISGDQTGPSREAG
jgi:two-component sensor histidine kinase